MEKIKKTVACVAVLSLTLILLFIFIPFGRNHGVDSLTVDSLHTTVAKSREIWASLPVGFVPYETSFSRAGSTWFLDKASSSLEEAQLACIDHPTCTHLTFDGRIQLYLLRTGCIRKDMQLRKINKPLQIWYVIQSFRCQPHYCFRAHSKTSGKSAVITRINFSKPNECQATCSKMETCVNYHWQHSRNTCSLFETVDKIEPERFSLSASKCETKEKLLKPFKTKEKLKLKKDSKTIVKEISIPLPTCFKNIEFPEINQKLACSIGTLKDVYTLQEKITEFAILLEIVRGLKLTLLIVGTALEFVKNFDLQRLRRYFDIFLEHGQNLEISDCQKYFVDSELRKKATQNARCLEGLLVPNRKIRDTVKTKMWNNFSLGFQKAPRVLGVVESRSCLERLAPFTKLDGQEVEKALCTLVDPTTTLFRDFLDESGLGRKIAIFMGKDPGFTWPLKQKSENVQTVEEQLLELWLLAYSDILVLPKNYDPILLSWGQLLNSEQLVYPPMDYVAQF